MAYPATSFSSAVDLTITAANQIHEVVNGDSLSTILVETGEIPTLRKALVDNFYFISPIDWDLGNDEVVFNQLRTFTDGSIWWSPLATVSNPVTMTADPYIDSNWTLSIVGNKNYIDEVVNFSDSLVLNGKVHPETPKESAQVGDTGLSSVLFLRDASLENIYEINEGIQTGSITALSFANLTATIGGVAVTLRLIKTQSDEVNISQFGAVSGSDCTDAINKAVATGKRVVIEKGFTAQYTGTLKVNGLQMRLDGDLEFMTNTDGLVVRGENTNVVGGGKIITNVVGYSKSLQQYLADDTYPQTRNNLIEINAIEILSLSYQGKCTHHLAGVETNTVRQLIISSNVKVQRLTGAANATLFECNPSPSAPSVTNWVNSNVVEVTFISQCAKAMVTRSPFFDLGNNLITETSNNTVLNEGGYQTGPQTSPPIISIQNNFNHYEGFIWDHDETDFPLVEFSRQSGTGSNTQSRQNKVDLRNGYSNATSSQPLITNGGIIDPFVDNIVLTQNDMGKRQHLVSLNASKRTIRNEATSFLGKVENWLAYANRKGYTITFKKNGVTHAKDVNNSFNNIGGSTFTLSNPGDITNVVTDRFELQILWDEADAVQTSFAGALFNQQMIKAMRVDLIQVGGKEVVLYNSTSLYTPFVINERPQAISNVRGVRFTFGDFVDDFIPNKSTADVAIGSFFLTTTNKNDSYFLTKGDDRVYGNHTFAPFFSPIITDEATPTTKWKLRAFGGNSPIWVPA